MAFGVLFDFAGNNATTRVANARDMVREQWFQQAVKSSKPIDMFVVLGHNPVGRGKDISTFPVVFDAIRAFRPDTPITFLGGHTHVRDTVVYDNKAVAMASGK
jgi:hypothetical protein